MAANGLQTGRQRAELSLTLAGRLASARVAARLSYRQLGASVGVACSHLWYLEHGRRRPSTAVARLLVDALELDDATAEALIAASAEDAGRSRKGHDGG